MSWSSSTEIVPLNLMIRLLIAILPNPQLSAAALARKFTSLAATRSPSRVQANQGVVGPIDVPRRSRAARVSPASSVSDGSKGTTTFGPASDPTGRESDTVMHLGAPS